MREELRKIELNEGRERECEKEVAIDWRKKLEEESKELRYERGTE